MKANLLTFRVPLFGLFLVPIANALVIAQRHDTLLVDENADDAVVLRSEDYEIRYDADTLQAFWRGVPAGTQLVRTDQNRAILYDEQARARLLVFTASPDDFRYYDRAYANEEWFSVRTRSHAGG